MERKRQDKDQTVLCIVDVIVYNQAKATTHHYFTVVAIGGQGSGSGG